jgi:hypothetical protein
VGLNESAFKRKAELAAHPDDKDDPLASPAETTRGAGVTTGAPRASTVSLAQAACGSAAFAWAIIAEKAAPSFIAISASTFRSSSTPASFSPCMNWL